MKCKNCIYFSGIECHGHGDFWGSCNYLNQLFKYIKKVTNCDYISTGLKDIVYDNTDCIILKKFGFEVKKINE